MALMFSRLARNFVKNGYFPTDDDTLSRIQSFLFPGEGHVRLLDPCCGEGAALADVCQGLQDRVPEPPLVETFGIEFDGSVRPVDGLNLTLAAIFNRINKAIALKGNQLRG